MAVNGATEESQESGQASVETKQKNCFSIFVARSPEKFPLQEKTMHTISESMTEFKPFLKYLTKCDNCLLLARQGLSKIHEIKVHDLFILTTFKDFTSSDDSSNNTASFVDPCDCFNCNLILRRILNSASADQWIFFGKCGGITFVSIANGKTSIPGEDFNKLETIVGQLIKLNNDIMNIINARVPLGESDKKDTMASKTRIISQGDFLIEMNEMVFQKRRLLKALNTLVQKFSRIREVFDDDQNPANQSKDGQSSVVPVNAHEISSGSAVQTVSSIPLQTLLQCIVTRMTVSSWEELRRYVGRVIPLRVLRDIPNGIEFFKELENRDLIRIGNTEYIRIGLYEIERVDLVHLLDCIQEGDYRLLQAETPAVRQNLEQSQRNRSSEDRGGNLGTSSQPPVIQNLTADAEKNDNTADQDGLWSISGHEIQDNPLQRKYRNVPHRTTTSPAHPVQEDREAGSSTDSGQQPPETGTGNVVEDNQEQISPNISNDDKNTSDQTTNTDPALTQEGDPRGEFTSRSSNSEGAHSSAQNTLTQGENEGVTLPQGEDVEDSREWVENREYPCDHYDRYCTVQFACCNRFWPCHRCHNSQSQCSERKLKSRDIKKLKCRRCGRVQDFPKDSPRCVECNLKFAEYFCPICQHLTGKQNHPFHCTKCGICRVHGDRSFHCDICGVCLDVNLRGNHRCREGSAHDECCVCFEDAFTGCQILPCSHKVHKECANQMVRNGQTQCPICRTSFADKGEKK
ncbi:uncharacterized protein LOC114518148 [Dendronephthya gigantea]|uniref:uncharacterized protein LOC114518148 n=1 Tax=Dendronephthya gigantea TaxID=151771 RepID=UPI00106C78B9|nr:uncharacterized protein LOC114518148 [Dendronephthya gigantea]